MAGGLTRGAAGTIAGSTLSSWENFIKLPLEGFYINHLPKKKSEIPLYPRWAKEILNVLTKGPKFLIERRTNILEISNMRIEKLFICVLKNCREILDILVSDFMIFET